MPRKPRQPHFYCVLLNCYASQHVKDAVESGRDSLHSSDQVVTISYYFGEDKRQAGAKFAQACTAAMSNQLAYRVTLLCDDDEIARAKPHR